MIEEALMPLSGRGLGDPEHFQQLAEVADACSKRLQVQFCFGAGGDAEGCHRGEWGSDKGNLQEARRATAVTK